MIKASIKYFREVFNELSHVVWPSFSEFSGATLIVLIVVVLSMLYVGFFDFVFAKMIGYIFAHFAG